MKPDVRTLAPEAAMERIVGLLSYGEQVPLVITGNSMYPFLRHGRDTVYLQKVQRPLKKGDMVLYRRKNGQYILHRIVFAGDTLTQKFRMQTVRTRLSVQDYDELKKILRQWEPASRIRCLFRAGGKIANAAAAFPEADALLTRSGKWTLHSASAGQHDLKMRIHVLNYAGVKRYSEVQIPFQPAWDLTPQIAGTVTSPDGKTIRKLSPSEINIMDQPWASKEL